MPTTDINDSCKAIQGAWENIKSDFFAVTPGHYLDVTCVYRSPDEQFELYKQGRTLASDGKWHINDPSKIVTNVDGFTVIGAHNYKPSRAIDVCVVDNQTGQKVWDSSWYQPLIDIAKRYNLVEGGTWRAIKDWPHLEVPDYKHYVES